MENRKKKGGKIGTIFVRVSIWHHNSKNIYLNNL